jgi:uncharacterized protein
MRMWISRALEPTLLRAVRERPVVVVTGARQVGKTSLVRRLLPRHHYVSLDLPSEAEQAERDPARFLQRHPCPLILDEVQYAPAVFRHLKSVVDARRSQSGLFVLTGSQLFPLMSGVSESLAGRAEILTLEGLSYGEAAAARRELAVVDFAVRGGFPELHEKPDLDAAAFQRSYIATYLERDVRALLNVGSLRDFERFLRASALRSAQLLNKAELARDVGVSPPTAAQWLSVLEASGQAAVLDPWFSNRTKSLVKTPKLYLADGGLLCGLLGVRTSEEFLASPLAGAIWETVVGSELRRVLLNAGRTGELHFWREREREVDFVIHRGGRFVLAEAKCTESPDARDATNLRVVAAQSPKGSVKRMAIICRCANAYPLGGSVEAIPLPEVGRLLV